MANVIKFIPTVLDDEPTTSRDITNLLPAIHQTDTIKRFFGSSINHLFSPGSGKQINGYVGQQPPYYDPSQDFYCPEPTDERQFYQLEPAMVSKDANGDITSLLSYPDIINQLRFQGAIVNNHNRLFEQNYYSWCPPVDIDKLVNFRSYFWVEENDLSPDYMIMQRGSVNGNPWSVNNLWFHKDDLTDDQKTHPLVQALRPIVEFDANLEIYNYGSWRRNPVYACSNNLNLGSLITAANQTVTPSIVIDGVTINESIGGVRILIVNDTTQGINNQIYSISFDNTGKLVLSLETDGLDPSGFAANGEIVRVENGIEYGSKELYYNGSTWVVGQQKLDVNVAPLFNLYDANNVLLNNPEVYPGSSFNGNKIFNYHYDTSGTSANDPVLGIPLTYDGNGQINFENYIATIRYSYNANNSSQTIPGFYFHKSRTNEQDYFRNDWYAVATPSRQMMVDQYVCDGMNNVYQMSQIPDVDSNNGLSNLQVYRISLPTPTASQATSTLLVEDVDYLRYKNNIILNSSILGDVLKIKTFSSNGPLPNATGFYEVPVNLQSNPNNEQISIISTGDYYQQFSQIMASQVGFTGATYSNNNWRNTARDLSKGGQVIQNNANILNLCLTLQNNDLDYMNAVRYSETEYIRFRNKFEQKIGQFFSLGKSQINVAGISWQDTWINDALNIINKGKTQTFPFAYNNVGFSAGYQIPSFIPATPSFLGVYPLYKPSLIVDYTFQTDFNNTNNSTIPTVVIRNHDGSFTPSYGVYVFDQYGNLAAKDGNTDPRDSVLLQLETRIFNSVNSVIGSRERPIFDWQTYYSTYSRQADYTYQDYITLLQPNFDRWITQYNLDFRTNSTFDASNPFSWNWSQVSGLDGNALPGHWRGIYFYYYDTDRPHTSPWEMLGFTDKPGYWDATYGNAPYTSNNLTMWRDLENGIIASGPRAGKNLAWARPNLSQYIPVDEEGNLLDPAQAGIAKNYPAANFATMPWKFGDCGPIEASWRRSPLFGFAVAQTGYLMKPARFFGSLWDSANYVTKNGQTIDQSTYDRPSHAETTIHGETDRSGSIIVKYGIQQWISEYLVSLNRNVTTGFGDLVRGLNVQLAYKMAGFTDATNLQVSSDAFGTMPAEDISVKLYQSPSIREEFYSGVIVNYDGRSFGVYGYDILNPAFTVIQPNISGAGYPITFGSTRPINIPNWTPGIYYTVGYTVNHLGLYYLCTRSHTASTLFEPNFWQEIAKPSFTSDLSVTWYTDASDQITTSIPYGTLFPDLQSVANFLNGLQRYYLSRGWQFEAIVNGQTSDWAGSCLQFLAWFQDNQSIPGAFIALSPASTLVEFNTVQGEAQSVEQYINGTYSLIDIAAKPISPNSVDIARLDGNLKITPTAAVSSGIFGCRVYVSELEHVVAFENTTIFNDIIYNPLLNLRQPRLRLQGFKTSSWKGRLDAPGFIVKRDVIVPNFDKSVDDLRHLFDVETVDDGKLQERARSNLGYSERDYLSNLLMSPTNQFEFYQGMIQQKGTPTVMNRLLRSNFIRNNEDIKFLEEWLFRVGDYGSEAINPSFDLQLKQSEMTTNPQLIVFNVNSNVDLQHTNNVIEITDTTGTNAVRDPRWIWQQDRSGVAWTTKQFGQNEKGFLPNCGYVNVNNISWAVSNRQELLNLYYSKLTNFPSTIISQSFDFEYDGLNLPSENTRIALIPNLTNGYLRINKVEFKIVEGFVFNSVAINVGRINDPQEFARASPELLEVNGDFTFLPSALFELNEHSDNAVYLEFIYGNLSTPVNANIGKVTITVSAEQFIYSVLPNHRALVYNDLIGNWNTYKLQDTYSVIDTAFVPSFTGQGVPISVESLDPAIAAGDLLILDGVNNSVTTSDQYVFNSVVNPVFSNTSRTSINQSLLATATVNASGFTEIPLFQAIPEAGMVIDKFTFNVIEAFSGGSVSAKIQVGNDSINNYFVKSFTPLSEFTENNPEITIAPSFDINTPVSIDIYDTTVSVSNTTTHIPVQIIRSGNIYNTLTSITVTNPGSGYVTAPLVSISGPQGVKAVASLAGGVSQILVTNGGVGYTSNPSVLITGANGSGAQAYATISSGVVTSIVVTSPGSGYTSSPEVIIGGGGGNGASAISKVNYGVASVAITDTGGCLYDGTVTPTVSFIGGGGSGATATTGFNTPLTAMTVNWRYYKNSPNVTGWVEGGSVTFEPVGTPLTSPQDPATGYWLQTVELPVTLEESDTSIYQLEIYDSDQADTSYQITQNIATITVVKTDPGNNGVDLTKTGTTTILGNTVSTNDMLKAYMLPNGNTGVVILSVDYHYTKGFEAFNTDGTPNVISGIGNGGRILGWYRTHFQNLNERDNAVIPGGWQPYDIVEVDYVPDVLDTGGWATYEYFDPWAAIRTGLYNVNALLAQINALLPTASDDLSTSISSALDELGVSVTVAEINALIPGQTTSWTQLDSENLKVDSSQFVNATIYNKLSRDVLTTLQLFDPYQGYIVGTADRELAYKTNYDPATYNKSSDPSIATRSQFSWGREQVNQLWWDTSTVRYIDYQISDASYRWKHWGELAPGASIDVYQWVRSPVPPSSWSIFTTNSSSFPGFDTTPTSGLVVNPSIVGWAEQQEWIPILKREVTVYYFWVKDVNEIPQNCGRQLSAVQIETIIQNPASQDVAWFAAIDSNKLIVSGVKQYLNDTDTVLNLKWKLNSNEGNYHKQWKIIREGDTTTSIDIDLLWNKMRDSLVGWNDYVSSTTTSTNLTSGFASSDHIINVADASGFAENGIVTINGANLSYRYKYGNQLKIISNYESVSGNIGDIVTQIIALPAPQIVPDPMLTPKESIGNLIRPRQTWFAPDDTNIPSRYARQIFVESFNKLMQEQPFLDNWYQWQKVFGVIDPVPGASEYVAEASSLAARNQLALSAEISFGQTVLVTGTADTSNFWTVWRYDSNEEGSNLPVFSLVKAQKYGFEEGYLWTRADWYSKGWSAADFPLYHFPSRAAFMAAPPIDDTLLKGTLIMIDRESESDPRWSWQVLQNGLYVEVAKQAATVELTSVFYDPGKTLYGFDGYNLADIPNRDGSWELKTLLDNIPDNLFTAAQMNKLFFDMSRCALSMNNDIDWMIKSSFMTIGGYSEPLQQNPLSYPAQINSIMSYIQEVKPYHVTVRNYLVQYTAGQDIANIAASDIDNGYGLSQSLNYAAPSSGYSQSVSSAQATAVSQTNAQLLAQSVAVDAHRSATVTNITPFPNPNQMQTSWTGLRHIKSTILFDRIDCSNSDASGWDLQSWDYQIDKFVTDATNTSYVSGDLIGNYRYYQPNPTSNPSEYVVLNNNYKTESPSRWDRSMNSHAASRIDSFYAPTDGMPTNNLISGCEFKGYVFDGGPNAYGLWDDFGWSFEGGWANEDAFYNGSPTGDPTPKDQLSGEATVLVVDYVPGDIVLDGGSFKASNTSSGNESFNVDAGAFINPYVQPNYPEELVPLKIRPNIDITLNRNDGSGNITTATVWTQIDDTVTATYTYVPASLIAPAMDLSFTAQANTTTHLATSITTNHDNEIVVLVIYAQQTLTHVSPIVLNVSGGGLTWTRRGGNSRSGEANIEIWYASAATQLASVPVTVAFEQEFDSAAIVAFGVQNTDGWDANDTLPGSESFSTSIAPNIMAATSYSADLIIMAVGSAQGTAPGTVPPGFTLVNDVNNTNGTNHAQLTVAYKVVHATQPLSSVAWGSAIDGSLNSGEAMIDALIGHNS